MTIPPLFRCPISLDLFKDPVTLCTGQTYDRSCIEKWLSAGNLTCPVTMQTLDDLSLVPNHTLRHLIHEWLHSNIQVDIGCFDLSENQISVATIKQILESDESTLENKLQVVEKVHSLSQELPHNNSCLIKLDFFGILFDLVLRNAQGFHSKESLMLVEQSLICALKLMPFSELRSLNILNQESKYALFLSLFEEGNLFIKKSLCLVVEAISSVLETKWLCKKLGKSVKLVQVIVNTVEHKSEAVEAGVRALSALSLMESNRENMASQGAVEWLIAYLSDPNIQKKSLAAMAMSTIENLLLVNKGKDVILNHPVGVKAIVKMVFRVSEHEGSESAVDSLLMICSDSKTAREKVIVEGVLTQLLLLLQSQCNAETKTKARMLLKLLRSMWNEDPNNVL